MHACNPEADLSNGEFQTLKFMGRRQTGFHGEDKVDYCHEDFRNVLDDLVNTSEIVTDRPKGSALPGFPDFIYRVDYGYLKNTTSMDGAGIDVWVGSGYKSPPRNHPRSGNLFH